MHLTTPLSVAPRAAFWSSVEKSQRWRLAAGLALLLFLWIRFLRTLVMDWEVDPQYSHGWFIPILAGILIATRWRQTPQPRPSARCGWLLAGITLGLLLIGPLAFLQEVHPEARPFQWLHGALVAGVTFGLLMLYGGKAWARHFAFPIIFLLLSVPWPREVQNRITNDLMYGVASATVEVTLLAGIPALQHGNTIGLNDSVVGIDEACSGVRSLQGSMIIGLFLGSYFPMLPFARVLLVCSAVVGSLLLNVVRATALTWISATAGAHALERFHDPAGLIVLLGVFAATVGLAQLFHRRWPMRARALPPRFTPWAGSTALGAAGVAGVCWLGLTDLGCRAYFGAPTPVNLAQEWRIDYARLPGVVQEVPISPTARQFLRYDSGQSRMVDYGNGLVARSVELLWRGGEISAAGARLHGPAVCLPNLGYELKETLEPLNFRVHGIEVAFNQLVFQAGERTAYVYHGLWENGRATVPDASEGDQSLRSAWRAVWQKRRLEHARVWLIMLTGPTDSADAENELQQFLEKVITPPAV